MIVYQLIKSVRIASTSADVAPAILFSSNVFLYAKYVALLKFCRLVLPASNSLVTRVTVFPRPYFKFSSIIPAARCGSIVLYFLSQPIYLLII